MASHREVPQLTGQRRADAADERTPHAAPPATGDRGAIPVPPWRAPNESAGYRVSSPDDQAEREADSAADAVMRGGSASVTRSSGEPLAQRKCAACGERPEEPCAECATLQRSAEGGSRSSSGADTAARIDAARAGGAPLPPEVRRRFEPRFGVDFGGVRVHADGEGDALARAVDARAFTIGNNLFVRRDQYAPSTERGDHLLAHELAHVVQQSAMVGRSVSAGGAGGHTIARLPAADPHEAEADGFRRDHNMSPGDPGTPSNSQIVHQLTTPRLDVNKIRIDAVPDFVLSSFSARDVGVTVSDSSMVALDWELIAPDGHVVRSTSTTPGARDATTRPFRLDPAQFTGGAFGQYQLHCTGRDANGWLRYYAARDFNVMQSDLTTGTALPTRFGQLTFVSYQLVPVRTGWSADVELRFLPDPSVAGTDIGWIQALQSISPRGSNTTINAEQAARTTSLSWAIDRRAGRQTPFQGTGLDPQGREIDVPGYWGTGGATPHAATLTDTPGGGAYMVDRFESCVVCRSGPARGQVYGCATWGISVDAQGAATLMPRSFRQMPSEQFEGARQAWNNWAPGATPPRDQAPPLRSP